MPDIDLEPHEYRREPVKGENILTSSGVVRLGILFIAIVLILLANTYLRPPIFAFFDALLRP